MSAYLFIGPTLRQEEVSARLDVVCLPPVARGDVYRVALERPQAIGIVDGYFSGAPSVWHKEILWALSQGIAVFGSASMGALRAAELHSFGMQGVGRIFEMFRDGILEDDDEVAVLHGPAEIGFTPLSESMVNIRATLARAEDMGILSPLSRRSIESLAKSLFFASRSWAAVIECAGDDGLPEAELRALQAWLPKGRVDQKREDALEMLGAMSEIGARREPSFQFEWTHFWDEFVTEHGGPVRDNLHSLSAVQGILDELRLEGRDAYERVKEAALLRLLAGLEAKRHGLKPATEAVRGRLTWFRSRFGLFSRAQLDAWLQRNDLDAAYLERLIADVTAEMRSPAAGDSRWGFTWSTSCAFAATTNAMRYAPGTRRRPLPRWVRMPTKPAPAILERLCCGSGISPDISSKRFPMISTAMFGSLASRIWKISMVRCGANGYIY